MDLKLLLQIVGVALGLLYLYLEYKADIRLWIVGLIMPCVHGLLYFKAGLYADFSMQLYYILAGLYGWIVWHNAPRNTESKAQCIQYTPTAWIVPLVAVYAAAHGLIYLFLTHCTNSNVPFWDSLTTALSVVAMWMLSRKLIEQWIVWGVVDLITVGLYLYKGIPLTASLYGLYTLLAVAGYLRWRREIRKLRIKN
jgi:nicotinamide mononucleotide transporter